MPHEEASKPVRARAFVSGQVQGVNYRWECVEQARQHGVSGWVRNLADGRVEAVFEGPEPAVRGMLGWCERGPAHARVDHVKVSWEPPTGAESGFRISQ